MRWLAASPAIAAASQHPQGGVERGKVSIGTAVQTRGCVALLATSGQNVPIGQTVDVVEPDGQNSPGGQVSLHQGPDWYLDSRESASNPAAHG